MTETITDADSVIPYGFVAPFYAERDDADVIHIYDAEASRVTSFNRASQVPDDMFEEDTQSWLHFAEWLASKMNSPPSPQSQLAEREEEIERLRDYAREVSKAFTAISGGGSEMFIRIGEDFYADPKACRERVESKIATMRKHMRLKRIDDLSQEKA